MGRETLAALAEDTGLVLSNIPGYLLLPATPVWGNFMSSSELLGHLYTYGAHIDMQRHIAIAK